MKSLPYTPLPAIYPVLFLGDNSFCVSFQRYSMQNIHMCIHPFKLLFYAVCQFTLFNSGTYLGDYFISTYKELPVSLCILKSTPFYECVTIHFPGPLLMDI